MSNRVVHFEIQCANGESAEKFYGELFGWHIRHMPEMGYGVVDTHAGSGINGGIGGNVEEGGQYITFYAAADDPQAILDKAESLGGKTIMPVTEIPNVVTFALFADPEGNVVGVVKDDPAQTGPGVSPGLNPPVNWFEVVGTDGPALREFYGELFGWRFKMSEGPTDYGEVQRGEKGIGGGVGTAVSGRPMTTVYAEVDDLAKYLERAESLGATTVMKPTEAGEQVTIALFADPQGNEFGLYARR